MKNYIYILPAVLFFSCSNNKTERAEQTSHTDTVAVSSSYNHFPFKETELKKMALPFTFDTLFVQKVDSSNRITYQQVRGLGVNFLKSELGDGLSYDFNNFCEIDSLKQIGKYVDYVNHLDIGMTKRCIAYKLGWLDMGNNNKIYVWGIEASSFEACPYFSGTTIIATFLNAEKEVTHFKIAEISGGGDPPASGNDQITAVINADGKIKIEHISIGDDSDLPGKDESLTTIQLKTDGNKIVVTDTKTDVKSKEEQQAQ